jgi:hypothetical protein
VIDVMPAYPKNVRSPGQTGSRRDPAKPTQMTQMRHQGARELSRLELPAVPMLYQAVTLNGGFGETPYLVQISIESV